MLKLKNIKIVLKHIISSVLLLAVLLPFAVQFTHSFENHKHVCDVNNLHIDEHKIDCSVFHFKINQNSIDFSSEIILTINTSSNLNIITSEAQLASIPLTNKSSRAPPSLLI